ncbi:MAG: hypothetical protein COA67_03620 [Lutibacter sp.]|nr:MAG: hypothetical protein COA67_03620 [Lutibacter sp.]
MFLGCNGNSDYNDSGESARASEKTVFMTDQIEVFESPQLQEDSKIIKESNLRFETASIENTHQTIVNLLEKHKGFIQRDQTSKNYNTIEKDLTIRIPTDGFQPTLDGIAQDVKAFDRKEISQRDVTEEFIDLEARLKAKRKLETRYLELLKKAKNVKEMLEIEREVAKIREEIEAKQGRLKYLQNKVSLSTINVSFYETVAFEKAQSQTYFSRVIKALKGGFTGIGEFIIGILYLWPFILIGVIFFIYIRKKVWNTK